MDQLTAYKVLGLKSESTLEEIKEAYATLSKQYHPEEEPEKFQEIHEAYVTLTRRNRRGNRGSQETFQERERISPVVSVEEVKQNVPKETPVQEKEHLNFHEAENYKEEEKKSEYAFDEALVKAQKQTDEKLYQLALEAGAELKILASPKYKSNLKAYRALFTDKKYEQIIRKEAFLERLCEVLEETKLQKRIYDFIIDFYRLRGMQPSELSSIGLRLYQVLDEKAGIKKKVHPATYGGVLVAIGYIFRMLRPVIRQSEVLTGIVLGIVGVALFIWLMKKVIERRSPLFTQGVLSLILAVSQFIIIMNDGYGTLFGSIDTGNSIAAVIFILACVWLVVVILVAVIKWFLSHTVHK